MGLFYKHSLCFLALPVISIFIGCSDSGSGSDANHISTTDENGDTISIEVKSGSFTDSRDGRQYKTVTINKQTWMAENLNYGGSGSCYNDSSANCTKYGRLYTLSDAETACPAGWHLPYGIEWNILINLLNGAYDGNAGGALKAKSGWGSDSYGSSGNGDNASGFNALPAGFYDGTFSEYEQEKYAAAFWANSNLDNDNTYSQAFILEYDDESAKQSTYRQRSRLSVRCISDENSIVEENGLCGASNDSALAFYDSVYYTCDTNVWRYATKSEVLTGCNSSLWGDIRTFNDTSYICEGSSWTAATASEVLGECDNLVLGTVKNFDKSDYICKDYSWTLATKAEMAFGLCTDELESTTKTLDSTNYICNGKNWRAFTSVEDSLGICKKDEATGTYDGITFTCDAGRNLWVGSFMDARDGKSYKAVGIKGNIWMAENLNYETDGRRCYNNIASNCDIYGGLYTWAAAMNIREAYNDSVYVPQGSRDTIRGICPEGWHIPDSMTVSNLSDYIEQAGIEKFKSTTLWTGNAGTDLYGLDMKPAGYWYYGEKYESLGSSTEFWSVTPESSYGYWSGLSYSKEYVYAFYLDKLGTSTSIPNKGEGLSVRCIKNRK